MTNKPRIAILHYAAPPTIGGVEVTLAAHARLFAWHGYPVKIIAGRGEPFCEQVQMEIIPDAGSRSPRVLEVNAELARGIVSEKFHALVADLTPALEHVLADCDAVIVHNILSLHKNLALTVALRHLLTSAGAQWIAWNHDFAWSDPHSAVDLHPGFPWDLIGQPWGRVHYVVVSEARKKELLDMWRERNPSRAEALPEPVVVPAGIDVGEFFGVTAETARAMRDLGLLDAAPLLLLPARITPRKNIERAIEITAALGARGMQPKLIVTGPPGAHDPANSAYLERLLEMRRARGLEKAIVFMYEFGKVADAALRDLYLIADAVLFPSEREGFGIPALEAALARLPIFCEDIPPLRESAREQGHYFAPNEKAEAIAARMQEFFSQDATYQFKRRVASEYRWEKIFSERIEPLIRKE